MEAPRRLCIEVPHHISAFWLPFYEEDPLRTGSIGAGFLIKPNAVACYPGRGPLRTRAPRQANIIRRVLKIKESIPFQYRDPLPHSVGYAVSAAFSISYSFYLLMHARGRTMLGEICRAAHIAEVRSGTGLGDVSAICMGKGIVIRQSPGAPGYSAVDSLIESIGKYRVITSIIRKMSTEKMLQAYGEQIKKEGERIFKKFAENPSLSNLVEAGREFSLSVGMMTREMDEELKRAFRRIDALGYFVKKGLIVVVVEKGEVNEALESLISLFGNARSHTISENGLSIRELME